MFSYLCSGGEFWQEHCGTCASPNLPESWLWHYVFFSTLFSFSNLCLMSNHFAFHFFFFFVSHPFGMWEFPVQGLGIKSELQLSLCHSHGNTGSEPHLRPTPQLATTPDPAKSQWELLGSTFIYTYIFFFFLLFFTLCLIFKISLFILSVLDAILQKIKGCLLQICQISEPNPSLPFKFLNSL